MKVVVNGDHVKTVPKKYEVLGDITLFMTDLKRKRLLPEERERLDKALAWFITTKELKVVAAGKHILDMLKDDSPECAVRINLRGGQHYYTIRTAKKKEIRVPESIYNMVSPKQTAFRNY